MGVVVGGVGWFSRSWRGMDHSGEWDNTFRFRLNDFFFQSLYGKVGWFVSNAYNPETACNK